MKDMEKGELKNMFVTNVKKGHKAVQKMAKSGVSEVKRSVKKQINKKKREAKDEEVFNVDIELEGI
jgi:hypothetical protein